MKINNLTLLLRLWWIVGMCAIVLLAGCGVSNNVTVTTQTGACSDGTTNAPYCMSATITNNGSTQNWINSTTAPMSNLVVTASGANNIQTPSNNTSSLDPNGCTTKTLNPGSSCTFFLKINGELYSTTTTETITVNMSYTLNSNLFGGGSTYSNSFTVYQVTNLYIPQQNGNLIVANAAQINSLQAESIDTLLSSAVDTTSFGYLYLGGKEGIYQYGNSTITSSITTSTQGPNGGSNLFTLGSNLYAAGANSSPTVWLYSLANESWTPTSYASTAAYTPNVNSVSADGSAFYLATANQVLHCPIGGSSPTCIEKGDNLANVKTLAATEIEDQPYTGLYAGTESGLFVEVINPAGWVPVTYNGNDIGSTSSSIVSSGNLYAGDTSGNIWFINSTTSTPNIASQFLNGTSVGSGKITNMTIDNVASVLYFIVQSGSTYSLYACSIATPATCTNLQKAPSTISISSPVIGLNIGSQLVSSLNSQPN